MKDVTTRLSQIKTFIQDLRKTNAVDMQKAVNDAAEISSLLASIPTIKPSRELQEGPSSDNIQIIPAVIDGTSVSNRTLLLDPIRPLSVLLDGVLSQLMHSGAQAKKLTARILSTIEELKKLVLGIVSQTPADIHISESRSTSTNPARVTISAICELLLLLMYSRTQNVLW